MATFNKGIVFFLVILLFSMTVEAQPAQPTFAAVHDGMVTIYSGGAAMVVQNPPNRGFNSLVWSRDGSRLAYLLNTVDFTSRLMVTDASASTPIMLDAGEIEAGFPVTFDAEGNIIYVGRGTPPSAENTNYRADVKQIAPQAGAQAQTLGGFAMGIGCGGGSPLPGDWLYWEEAGFGGSHLILEMTDYGLLHNTSCTGVGLALLDLQTGQDTPIGPEFDKQQGPSEGFGRAALSPDGTQVAALYTRYAEPSPIRTLAIIDLATLNVTEVKTTVQPDQVVWGADGSLFYSVTTFKVNLVDALTADEKQKLSETNTLDIPGHEVSIYHIIPADGQEQMLYQSSAYVIGRMKADSTRLLFSQIANQDAWIKAIADGTLDVMQDDNGSQQRALVPVTLYQLMLDGSTTPTSLGASLTQFTVKPG